MPNTIISKLIQEGKKGTENLYSKIPFFLRSRLDLAISSSPWARVKEGCDQQDQECLQSAQAMYSTLLANIDEYIKVTNQRSQNDINCTLMMLDKHRLVNEFQNDSVRFVAEMALCLEREKELIFTYSESELTEGERSDDNENITDQTEDREMKYIEELTQQVDSQLYQTRKQILDRIKFMKIPVDIFQSIQDHDVNELNPNDTDALEGIRPYYAEIESIEMSNEQQLAQIVLCKEKAIETLNEIDRCCTSYVSKLLHEIEAWKAAEARRSVRVGPETNTGGMISKFKKFGDVLNTIRLWFFEDGHLQVIRKDEQEQANEGEHLRFSIEVGRIEISFQNIEAKFLKFVLIVTQQPKGAISIENKGKKDSPNYCTKKTQPFSTTVRVLAGESFQNFQIMSKEIDLVAEKDLAQGSTAPVTGRDGQSCLKVEPSMGNTLPDIQFNIEVRNFHRVEQNNVYKQFFRIIYRVRVSVNGNEYHLQTMSLPFTFNTGANQILEHMGARMWYCASVQDLYNSGFQCPDPLLVYDVISILDSRVAYLGKKTRRLTESEKEFLKSRLPVASDETVTMQGFLKDKMRKLRSDEPLSFSFYTWFYAVTNSIEQLLLNAWQDGIIYGFCSEKTAEKVLMSPEVPEGTFILRPSVSEIKKTSSTDATAALAMEVKMRKEDAHPFDGHDSEFQVMSIPLMFKHIEKNTLYGAIRGITMNNIPVAKFLYGRDGGRKLDILKGYVKKKQEQHFPEYRILMEKIEKFNIRQCTKTASVDGSDGDEDSGREPSKRKRKHRDSSTSTQGPSFSQSSSVMCDTPSGSLPAFSNTFPFVDSSPSVVGDERSQGQRSGTQVKENPDVSNVKVVSGRNIEQTNGLKSERFGNVIVDLSQIVGQSSHGNQSDHTLSHFIGVNNSGFGESADIQSDNIQYTITVNTSLDSRANSSMQGGTPIRSVSSGTDSSPSPPGNTRASPHFNPVNLVNLPTVLNETFEPKKTPRRQGGGSKSREKKPANPSEQESKPLIWAPYWESNIEHLPNVLQLPNGVVLHCESNCDMIDGDIGSNVTVLTMEDSYTSDALELAASILEQRVGLQMSPDSGMGDQSPSPISFWDSHPLSAAFQSGSLMSGQETQL